MPGAIHVLPPTQAVVRADEGFLGALMGQVMVAGDGQEEIEEWRLIAIHELDKTRVKGAGGSVRAPVAGRRHHLAHEHLPCCFLIIAVTGGDEKCHITGMRPPITLFLPGTDGADYRPTGTNT